MNTNKVVFQLNSTENIKVNLSGNIKNTHPCDEAIIMFSQTAINYVLGIDCIKEEIESLYSLISEVIDNQAQLHPSIQDIGYLWNEEMQNKSGLTYNKLNDVDYWVGLTNLLWSTPSNVRPILSTWLYNDHQGTIILEITPSYPWHSRKPESHENFITYKQWIQNYQPLLIRKIPQKIATIWKNQAHSILEQIEKNISNNS